MLAARNRRFRIAAALGGVAWLLLAARFIVEAAHLSEYSPPGGYVVSIALFIAANLVGAIGWLVVARSFDPEIDWRRLRLGVTIVASTYLALYAAEVFRLIPILDHVHNRDYRGIYIATTLYAFLLTIGAGVVASGLADARRGASRRLRIWLGAIAVTAAYAAATVAQLYQQSFYSAEGAGHEFTIAALVMAVGYLGLALAALVFALGARRPWARREGSLAAAAAGGALASICILGGEAVLAITYSTKGAPAWEASSLWIALASRLLTAAALVAIALGARDARDAARSAPA
jgi:hypothetical protein